MRPRWEAIGGIDKIFSDSPETDQRSFLVDPHQAVRRQHRCQSPFNALAGQGSP